MTEWKLYHLPPVPKLYHLLLQNIYLHKKAWQKNTTFRLGVNRHKRITFQLFYDIKVFQNKTCLCLHKTQNNKGLNKNFKSIFLLLFWRKKTWLPSMLHWQKNRVNQYLNINKTVFYGNAIQNVNSILMRFDSSELLFLL